MAPDKEAKLCLTGPGQCWVVTHRASIGSCAVYELCANSYPQTTDSITESTHSLCHKLRHKCVSMESIAQGLGHTERIRAAYRGPNKVSLLTAATTLCSMHTDNLEWRMEGVVMETHSVQLPSAPLLENTDSRNFSPAALPLAPSLQFLLSVWPSPPVLARGN